MIAEPLFTPEETLAILRQGRGLSKFVKVSPKSGAMVGDKRCWNCGEMLPQDKRKYCNDECRQQYFDDCLRSYYEEVCWPWARDAVLRRCRIEMELRKGMFPGTWLDSWPESKVAKRWVYRCEDCGKLVIDSDSFEVHHVIALDGEDRHLNLLNRQSNLEGLCHDCHWNTERHGKKPDDWGCAKIWSGAPNDMNKQIVLLTE